MSERVLVTGATGNIGSHTVRRLVEAGVDTTIFARNEEKARSQFEKEFQTGHLTFVKGDYDDIESFNNAIKGHTRMLLLVADLNRMAEIKGQFGRAAYDAGVKQIVDISSFTVNFAKRGIISYAHTTGEEALFSASKETKKNVVILRPGYFLTNMLSGDVKTIKSLNKYFHSGSADSKYSLIDPRDIADVAVSVFLDPVEKHGNSVYDVHPEALSYKERAEIISKVLGREIVTQQVDIQARYNQFIQFLPHALAYDFVCGAHYDKPTPQISLLTKRPFRTFEDWVRENKHEFE
jgi:uncharacterized protein YbjT (DUF2867 family)